MQEVDFAKLVKDIKAKGGFEDYPVPLGPDLSNINIGNPTRHLLKNPVHMGDKAYDHGPYTFYETMLEIPQELVDAQHQSFKDALQIFMPLQILQQFMCGYFRANVLDNVNFYKVGQQLPDIDRGTKRRKGEPSAPWYYTFNLHNAKRKSLKRHYYTAIETYVVRSICKKRPELLATVLAYQSAGIAFLDKLKTALEQDKDLTDTERKRALKIQGVLESNWIKSSNFSRELLPAICLAYFVRDPSLKSDPNANDFEQGLRFAMKIGMFQNHATSESGRSAKFSCPAMTNVMSGSVAAVKDEACARPTETKKMGGLFVMIYQQIKKHQTPGVPVVDVKEVTERQARTTLILARAYPARLVSCVYGT